MTTSLRASTDLCNAESSRHLARLSKLCHWRAPATSQVEKCNFIKALLASLSAPALQQSTQRKLMKNFSLWPWRRIHNVPRPTSVCFPLLIKRVLSPPVSQPLPALPTGTPALGHPGCHPLILRKWETPALPPLNSHFTGTSICKPAVGGPEL